MEGKGSRLPLDQGGEVVHAMRAGRELTRSHGCFRFLAMTRLWLKLAGVGMSDPI